MSTSETQIFLSRSARARGAATALGWIGAVALGLGIGVLTSYGQGWLTGTSNAFVNSESAWLVAPFAVGALCRRPATAAWLGLLTCVMQLVGYEVTSELRYGAMSIAVNLGWGVAARVGPSDTPSVRDAQLCRLLPAPGNNRHRTGGGGFGVSECPGRAAGRRPRDE